MDIIIDPVELATSGYSVGDKGYIGDFHDDHHAIIVIGENKTHLHLIKLLSGEYNAIPKLEEFLKDIYITRSRFWGRFIKPRNN